MNTVEKLNLIRPRFVYLSLRVQKIPVPIFLFAPLVALEFFLMMGAWLIRRSGSRDQQLELALKALEALRGQTWELRKLPPFALVEVEIKSKVFDPNAPARVYLKVGLW